MGGARATLHGEHVIDDLVTWRLAALVDQGVEQLPDAHSSAGNGLIEQQEIMFELEEIRAQHARRHRIC